MISSGERGEYENFPGSTQSKREKDGHSTLHSDSKAKNGSPVHTYIVTGIQASSSDCGSCARHFFFSFFYARAKIEEEKSTVVYVVASHLAKSATPQKEPKEAPRKKVAKVRSVVEMSGFETGIIRG